MPAPDLVSRTTRDARQIWGFLLLNKIKYVLIAQRLTLINQFHLYAKGERRYSYILLVCSGSNAILSFYVTTRNGEF